MCEFWTARSLYCKIIERQIRIYSVPPPQCVLCPQLQIICFYIARHYVKKIARALRGRKKYKRTMLGGGGGTEWILEPFPLKLPQKIDFF